MDRGMDLEMDLGMDLGSDLLEDAREASPPRHRVVVVGETTEAVVEDLTERLEVLGLDALDALKLGGEVLEGRLQGLGLVQGRDDVVERVQHAQRVDLECWAIRVIDVDCCQSCLDLGVLLSKLEQTQFAEADLELGGLYVMPQFVPLGLHGVSVGGRAAVVLAGDTRRSQTGEHDQTQHLRSLSVVAWAGEASFEESSRLI